MSVEEIRNKLNEKIPRSAVSERSGGSGKSLSYLEGHYVIARLNAVFGQGNWCYGVQSLNKVFEGTIEGQYGSSYSTSYTATVKLVVQFDSGNVTEFIEVGYGDGSDKKNPGKAHELAVKEATTDALKRAAKNLGMSMGLALYDKEQVNVDDGEAAVITKAKQVAAAPANEMNSFSITKTIRDTAAVLIAKRKLTAKDLSVMLKESFNVDKADALTVPQAQTFLKTLEARL